MRTKQDMVREFMLGFQQPCHDRPTQPSLKDQEFRLSLNTSELFEIMRDIDDTVKRVDGFCDLLYTTYGWANTAGVRLSKSDDNEALPNDAENEKHFKWLMQCCCGAAVSMTPQGIEYWLTAIVDAVYGWADKFGVNVETLDKCFEEVHRSNMGKFWSAEEVATKPDAWTADITYADAYIVKDETGKVRKSPSWTEPKLKEILG